MFSKFRYRYVYYRSSIGFRKISPKLFAMSKIMFTFALMKKYQLIGRMSYHTFFVGCDTVEEGKAIIARLTRNAVQTETPSVKTTEFRIKEFTTGTTAYASPSYLTSTVECIFEHGNLAP